MILTPIYHPPASTPGNSKFILNTGIEYKQYRYVRAIEKFRERVRHTI